MQETLECEALGGLIQRRRSEIERRWLDRVREQEGAHTSSLESALPAYLDALAGALTDEAEVATVARVWSRIAREHAVTRVRDGFDVDEVVHELALLRQVLLEVALEERQPPALLVEAIEQAIDVPIAAAVHSYVDARDYQSRRSEAEHVAFMTHELRNPLSTATLAAAQLREMGLPGQEHERALELIRRSLSRLRQLIDGVLQVERMQAATVECRPVQATLGVLMDEALDGLREIAQAKGLKLELAYDPSLPLWLDPKLTATAVHNLVDNAVKFSDMGRIYLRVEDNGWALAFHVWDACEGLSTDELRTIFEPFRRCGHHGKAGTGFGLAVARGAIEAQGGSIRAESAATGCHFWITLPKVQH